MNKQKIALLIDSATDVPEEFIQKYNMYTVPLRILYKDREYTDKVDITARELYDRLPVEIPKTSLPNGNDVMQILDRIKADGYEKVFIVTISSGLSGTYNMMTLIAKTYQGLDIFVLDTKNIGIGAGFNAITAAENIENGMDFEELKEVSQKNVFKSKVFFCVATLEYLHKGGRIGLVASLLGSALNLKPIISCNEDGIYYTVAKVKGRKACLKKAMELALQFSEKGEKYNIAIANGDAVEEAEQIKEVLLPKLKNIHVYTDGQISPALGVHTGPGLIGIGVQLL